jgi:hypothetical protein
MNEMKKLPKSYQPRRAKKKNKRMRFMAKGQFQRDWDNTLHARRWRRNRIYLGLEMMKNE